MQALSAGAQSLHGEFANSINSRSTALEYDSGRFGVLAIGGRRIELSILFDLPCGQGVLHPVCKRIQMIGQFGKRFSLGFVRGQIGDQPHFSGLSAKMLHAGLVVLHSLYPFRRAD
jgi:hypothetical protein